MPCSVSIRISMCIYYMMCAFIFIIGVTLKLWLCCLQTLKLTLLTLCIHLRKYVLWVWLIYCLKVKKEPELIDPFPLNTYTVYICCYLKFLKKSSVRGNQSCRLLPSKTTDTFSRSGLCWCGSIAAYVSSGILVILTRRRCLLNEHIAHTWISSCLERVRWLLGIQSYIKKGGEPCCRE